MIDPKKCCLIEIVEGDKKSNYIFRYDGGKDSWDELGYETDADRNGCIFYIGLFITGERISLRSSVTWLKGNDHDGMSKVLKIGKDYTSETVIKLLLKIMKGRHRR